MADLVRVWHGHCPSGLRSPPRAARIPFTMQEDWSLVTGLFAYGIDAGQAVHALESRGFDQDSTSLVMSEDLEEIFRLENHVPSSLDSVYDSLLTALVNGLVSVGPMQDGGCRLVAGGAVLHALAGHGPDVGSDGLRIALTAYGLPAEDVRALPHDFEQGKMLVAVRCSNQGRERMADRALRIAGAERTLRA